ncbi:Slp family lipoprotein [Planctobacterium marinum]|uniref:Slp family lipoprotein n=1 Tax=Planctobacterium marinum TaxID=1631968 RepID=UPI001E50718F|nr:Slp family lipoprotein [Planctobacterium marinum]MCC2607378.1 Slp family lipoprotein [Planctobacterium marinum]
MNCSLIKRNLLPLIVMLLMAGCASVPESVQLPEDTPLVPYQQAAAEPDVQKDKMARWGGVIANIENKQDKTQLDLVFYPLRGYGRPIVGKESIGRFRVYVKGFLDPMVYKKGRSVTFAGKIKGIEEGLVGEHVYQYPTLEATGYYLWEDIDRIEIETISVWPHFRYGYPYGYRGIYGWNHWPFYQRHVVVRKHQHHNNGGNQGDSGAINGNHSNNRSNDRGNDWHKQRGNREP